MISRRFQYISTVLNFHLLFDACLLFMYNVLVHHRKLIFFYISFGICIIKFSILLKNAYSKFIFLLFKCAVVQWILTSYSCLLFYNFMDFSFMTIGNLWKTASKNKRKKYKFLLNVLFCSIKCVRVCLIRSIFLSFFPCGLFSLPQGSSSCSKTSKQEWNYTYYSTLLIEIMGYNWKI